ncbi:hypothetical protein B0H11DRAFT_2235834 [Mycena galericulata]|nr:hypothetical protein B0H11DRAFT_2235834 [Mycena galericulata]
MFDAPVKESAVSHLVHCNLPPSQAQMQIAQTILSQAKLEMNKLEARIAALNSASDEAELVVRGIQEAGECASQMQSILSPLRRLPPELLAEIFVFCGAHKVYYYPSQRKPPLLLLRVCRTWRAVALSTPELWARLEWCLRTPKDVDIIDTWISRSGARPLHLDIASIMVAWPTLVTTSYPGLTMTLFPDVERLARKHLHRLQTLHIRTASPDFLAPLLNGAAGLHTLFIESGDEWTDTADVDLHSLPTLRRVTLYFPLPRTFHLPWHQLTSLSLVDQQTLHNILQMLAQCHALVKCRLGFSWKWNREFPVELTSEVASVIFQALEDLELDTYDGYADNPAPDVLTPLFSSLTLPALRRLHIKHIASTPMPRNNIGDCLLRSMCPLETIDIFAFGRCRFAPSEIIAWLHAVSATLSSLSLSQGYSVPEFADHLLFGSKYV